MFAFVALAIAGFVVMPALYCSHRAKVYLQGSEGRVRLLRGAAMQSENVAGDASMVSPHAPSLVPQKAYKFNTGSSRFNGEWALVTHVMTMVAAGQVYVRDAHEYDDTSLMAREAIKRVLAPAARSFDTEAWNGDDVMYSLADDTNGHGAYLGYVGLALGWDRVFSPEGPWSDLHDAVIAALERRLSRTDTGVVASYPDEFYPADTAVAVAAVALHARTLARPRPALLDAWETKFRAHAVDEKSGLLWPSLGADEPSARASGTALAAWMLAASHPQLAEDLYAAIRRERYREVLGFAGIREFGADVSASGDINSGPLVFGLSPAATAFAIGAARSHGDLRTFSRLYASAYLFGIPVDGDERRNYVLAGPLGDAILAAALTALEPAEYNRIDREIALR